MLSNKHATLLIKILALLLIAALSFFVAADKIPETKFIKESLESIENSNRIVTTFSAATLSTSLAISLFPDDVATPLADSLADMNIYFVFILTILLAEKILLIYGVKLAFTILIPWACIAGGLSVLLKRDSLRILASRLLILGLAIALVVPCSTHITEAIAGDLTAYVETTISETEDGAEKLNEVTEGGTENQTIFEKMSDIFQTAINGVSDLLLYFRNVIRKCINSIAILILTNFLMPLLTFFVLRWILKETFGLIIPVMPVKRPERAERRHREQDRELVAVGGTAHEEE